MTTATIPTVDPHAELLGEIITWDMDTMEVAYPDVVAALQSAGLPTGDAADLRPVTAFGRAVRDLREGRSIDRVTHDRTSGVISFQFTRKALDSSGLQIAFDYEATCELQPDSGDITCPQSPEIETHARTMFAHAMAHRTTSDVTRLVQKLFQGHADLYPINPRKGVAYFVPEAHRSFTAQVEQFLSALGGRLLRFPVPKGTPEGNSAVKASVEDGLTALSHELDQAVDQWDEKTRQGTFTKATARWQEIKHKAEAYSEYLGDRQASLLAHLAEQKQRLAAKVMELTAAKDAAQAAAKHTDADEDTQPPLFPEPPAERPLFPGATVPIEQAAADNFPEDTEDVETTDQYNPETGDFQLSAT